MIDILMRLVLEEPLKPAVRSMHTEIIVSRTASAFRIIDQQAMPRWATVPSDVDSLSGASNSERLPGRVKVRNDGRAQ